jgi:hypothetical protein
VFNDNGLCESVDVELGSTSNNGWKPTGGKDSGGYYLLDSYYVGGNTPVQPTTAQPTTKAQPTTAQPTTKVQPTTAQPTTVQTTTVQPTTEYVPDYKLPDPNSVFTVKATSNYFPDYSMSFNKNTNQVTVTYALVSSKDMVNIEWYLDYDGTALKVNRASNTDEDLNWTIMPKVDGALININEANVIKANYSSIGSLSRIKSTNGNPVDLITVTFDVLRPVDTEINLRFKNLVVFCYLVPIETNQFFFFQSMQEISQMSVILYPYTFSFTF